jgi:transposase
VSRLDDVDGLAPTASNCRSIVEQGVTRETAMQKFARIGVDLAKNYFQVHALSAEGKPAVKRKTDAVKNARVLCKH